MIPKIIWVNWFQGWGSAPALTKSCYESWVRRNPNWQVVALSNKNISNYVDLYADFPSIRGSWLSAQALSDLLRISLLKQHGGLWVDATVWCARQLDEWLPEVAQTGFFAFERPAADRMLASWFLAAGPKNEQVARWHSYCLKYWTQREVEDEYFWFHYRFAEAYEEDSELRRMWDSIPKISAGPPHQLQPLMSHAHTAELGSLLAGSGSVVFKLDHRYQPDGSDEETTLYDAIANYWIQE